MKVARGSCARSVVAARVAAKALHSGRQLFSENVDRPNVRTFRQQLFGATKQRGSNAATGPDEFPADVPVAAGPRIKDLSVALTRIMHHI
jgi:hypothetical protein